MSEYRSYSGLSQNVTNFEITIHQDREKFKQYHDCKAHDGKWLNKPKSFEYTTDVLQLVNVKHLINQVQNHSIIKTLDSFDNAEELRTVLGIGDGFMSEWSFQKLERIPFRFPYVSKPNIRIFENTLKNIMLQYTKVDFLPNFTYLKIKHKKAIQDNNEELNQVDNGGISLQNSAAQRFARMRQNRQQRQ